MQNVYLNSNKTFCYIYNVEDEIFLRHSNRDAKESFSIMISEERSGTDDIFCKFSICKWILETKDMDKITRREATPLRRKVF